MQNRKGFTLIELLIVVVIIGILAAIAIPKFANTKEKAYIASMKSDLRNVATAQEAYFADKNTYGTDAQIDFKASKAVTVTATGDGKVWNAKATHTGTATKCEAGIGTGAAAGGGDGEPVCG